MSSHQERTARVFELASEATTTSDETVLLEASSYPHRSVRRAVAANPATPGELLACLAADLAREVRAAALTNPNLRPSTLDQLESPLPKETVELILAHHPDGETMSALHRNWVGTYAELETAAERLTTR